MGGREGGSRTGSVQGSSRSRRLAAGKGAWPTPRATTGLQPPSPPAGQCVSHGGTGSQRRLRAKASGAGAPSAGLRRLPLFPPPSPCSRSPAPEAAGARGSVSARPPAMPPRLLARQSRPQRPPRPGAGGRPQLRSLHLFPHAEARQASLRSGTGAAMTGRLRGPGTGAGGKPLVLQAASIPSSRESLTKLEWPQEGERKPQPPPPPAQSPRHAVHPATAATSGGHLLPAGEAQCRGRLPPPPPPRADRPQARTLSRQLTFSVG